MKTEDYIYHLKESHGTILRALRHIQNMDFGMAKSELQIGSNWVEVAISDISTPPVEKGEVEK